MPESTLFGGIFLSCTLFVSCSHNSSVEKARTSLPKTIKFIFDTSLYQELLNEEMIVVFSGTGSVSITNGKNLDINFGEIAHLPANTEHQVFNTGNTDLKYSYITTKSK